MITLYGFGPAFGLPDPSPFVMKTDVQLKMSGLPYRFERGGPRGGPKGKVPYVEDGGVRIGDSTFIRDHIEETYGIDLDRALSSDERARGWAIERMLEDHLYFALIHARWLDDANFAKGPAHFFDALPEETREQARNAAREGVRANLYFQGLGRHSDAEIADLGVRTLGALSTILDGQAFLFGSEPSSADATAFGMVAGVLTPFFATKLRERASQLANLVAYNDRMMKRYYPDFAGAAIAAA
jgi:glutathione S-transferase